MKILLVQPFKDAGLANESWPPIGLGYLATAVRKAGHEVQILDCLKDCRDNDDFVKAVKKYDPQVIGYNVYSIAVPLINGMLEAVANELPDVISVWGGPHVSSLPDRILKEAPLVDFAIQGEGEVPLPHLLNSLERGIEDYDQIPGLIYRDGDTVKKNESHFQKNIEEYGFPAWDLIQPKEYFRYFAMGPDTVPVFLSRGCPFPCTFCAAMVVTGRSLRWRGYDHIFEELRFLQKEYGIKRFVLEDEGTGVAEKFLHNFCNKIKEYGFKGKFAMGVGMRLDQYNEELLREMAEAGFEKRIVLGIESGSERVLAKMKKDTNIALIREKVELMDRMGYEPNGYFIVGFPTETPEEIEKTVQLALSLPIHEASFTAFQPLPHTPATDELIANGELPADYDFSKLVQNGVAYAPKGMTVHQVEKLRKQALLRFYMRPKILFRYFKSFTSFKYAFKKFVAVFTKDNVIPEPNWT